VDHDLTDIVDAVFEHFAWPKARVSRGFALNLFPGFRVSNSARLPSFGGKRPKSTNLKFIALAQMVAHKIDDGVNAHQAIGFRQIRKALFDAVH
jgi:hypothetical protein